MPQAACSKCHSESHQLQEPTWKLLWLSALATMLSRLSPTRRVMGQRDGRHRCARLLAFGQNLHIELCTVNAPLGFGLHRWQTT